MRTPPGSSYPEADRMESFCSPSSAHGLPAQRHGDWGCLFVFQPQTSNVAQGSPGGLLSQPAPKMQTSTDSLQPERASLESCCSASFAHGTARTEAQRLGLLACLATSNFTCIREGPCRAPCAAQLRKCECLQIALTQKGLAWKDLAQFYLPMTLLAQSHRDWGCLLVLPPQTSNVVHAWGGPCQAPPAALLRDCESLQIALI